VNVLVSAGGCLLALYPRARDPTWSVGHLGQQWSKTPLPVASLHFEFCTFPAAAPDQLEPPSGAADTWNW
jgi:hypothetical protein